MTITLDQIKSLRAKTGVSAMACKKALTEANGDETEAIAILRKKGEAKATERSDRSALNGVVAVIEKDNKAVMLTLACETDFVAKNEDFIGAAKNLAEKILAEGEDVNLDKELAELTVSLGEKIEIKEKALLEGENIASYTHMNNKIGVLLQLKGKTEDGQVERDVAMHIAAMNPKHLSPEDTTAEVVEKEKEIWKEQLAKEGKPEAILGKIMEGKERKFREESALLTQSLVMKSDQLVKDVLGDMSVEKFLRFEV